MARVPADEVERLKASVSVRRLAEARGVGLTPEGGEASGDCCFCGVVGGFSVNEAKNLWHCRGCSAGGSAIDFTMKAEGVTFRHACELLREGVDMTGPVGPRIATVPKLASPLTADADGAALMGQVRDYYARTLADSPEALAYLEARGLKHEGLIRHFRLGFSNRTLGLRLPDANRSTGALLRGRLQQTGLVKASGHEALVGSLVVPLHDETGAVAAMYGRKITKGLRPGTPLHLYVPAAPTAVFNAAALAGQRAAIVCASLFDAFSFWVAGCRHVTATHGLDGFTQHHLEALQRHGIRDVLLAYARTDAGDAAADALAKRLSQQGLQPYRVLLPRGMDVNAFACKVQPAGKALAAALRGAVWLGSGPAPATASYDGHLSGEGASSPPALASPPAIAPAAPVPVALDTPLSTPDALQTANTETPGDVVFTFGPRRYRVRGLAKASSPECLKINLLVAQGDVFHVDTFDVYSARQRAGFIQAASEELRVDEAALKRDVGQLLLQLEALQEEALKAKLAPKKAAPTLTDDEAAAAMGLLTDANLLGRITEDFQRCGMVGEAENALVGYLAAVSRKLEAPLAVLIQSSSAAGKSSLMEAVLAFVPEEDKTKYSAMTGQSLFYMGDIDLKHKVLAIVEEEGASRASYALKLLQSEGELTIASTGKSASGKLVAYEYRVEGPTQLFLTTTASVLDVNYLSPLATITFPDSG